MSRWIRITTVLMLVLILGLQWTVLQSMAWVSMLARFSTEGSFKEAIVKTFDGEHPCQLCIAVQMGKKAEQKSKQKVSVPRFDLYLDLPAAIKVAPPILVHQRPRNTWCEARPERPPVPPPRTT